MKVGIAQAIVGQRVKRRSLDNSAERTGSAIAHIVDQDPDYVRGAGGCFHGLRPPFFGLREGSANDSLVRLCRLCMQRETPPRRKYQCRCQRIEYVFLVHKSPVGFSHWEMTRLKGCRSGQRHSVAIVPQPMKTRTGWP